MIARTVALWVPRGKRPPGPEYYAPWIETQPPRKSKQQTPHEIFQTMKNITALQERRWK